MYNKEDNPFIDDFTQPTPDISESEESTMREKISPNDLLFVGNNDLYDKDHNNYNFCALGLYNKNQDSKIETIETNLNLLKGNRNLDDLNNRSELVWHADKVDGDYGIYGFNRSVIDNGSNQNIVFRRNGYWDNGNWTGGDQINLQKSDTNLVLRWLPYDKNDSVGNRTKKYGNIFTTIPIAPYFNYYNFDSDSDPNGMGVPIFLASTNFSRVALKYLYINLDGISFPSAEIGNTGSTPYNYNYSSGTSAAGIKYDNSSYVLVEVYITH